MATRENYFENKISKLDEQYATEKKSDLFLGVSVWVDGLTTPPREDLKKLLIEHGGKWVHYVYSGGVTHVVCENLPDGKIRDFKKRKNLTVVMPSWIIECIREKKLLAPADYVPACYRDSAQTNLTFEPHQRLITSNSNPAASETASVRPATASDAKFLSSFFQQSRLHFIGAWRDRVHELKSNGTLDPQLDDFPKVSTGERRVMHVDMDCFFATVACISEPGLLQKPLAICHSATSGKSGEVSCANYVARARGVKNGMFMAKAAALCPDLIVRPYNFPQYQKIGEEMLRILYRWSSVVVVVSVDEAYLDVSHFDDLEAETKKLRDEIFEETKCSCSAGVSRNQLLARLCTKRAKASGPDNQYILPVPSDAEISAFLQDIKIQEMPGIGWKRGTVFDELGIKTVGQALHLSKDELRSMLGKKKGEELYDALRGIDNRDLQVQSSQRHSIGAQASWGVRLDSAGHAIEFLSQLSREVSARLLAANATGRTLTLKIWKRIAGSTTTKHLGHGPCDIISRSKSLASSTVNPNEIETLARDLLLELHLPVADIRGVGLTMSRLTYPDERSTGNDGPICENSVNKMFEQVRKKPRREEPDPPLPGHDDSALPRPSQLDQSVVSALPTQIRAEMVREYSRKGLAIPESLVGTGKRTSAASSSATSSSTKRAKFPSKKQVLVLEDGGVVDMETLDELPEDVRNEIRRSLRFGNPAARPSPSRVPLTSGIASSASLQQSDSQRSTRQARISEEKRPHNSFEAVDVEDCGELSEIREHIVQWLESNPEPQQEHRDFLAGVVLRLVKVGRCEEAQMIVQCISRITKSAGSKWKTTVAKVLEIFEKAVAVKYLKF